MKNYIISLISATDRRSHIAKEFGKQGIDFEFFDAVTPETLQTGYQNLGFLHYDTIDLSDNEQSCFCSHATLWQKMLDDDLEYIAIFEDDIYLSQDAHLFLQNDAWIKDDWDLIKLEKVSDTVLLSLNKIVLDQTHKLSTLKSCHVGAGGYILSKKMAKVLLSYIKNSKKIDHVDQILFRDVLDKNLAAIYQINPVLCIQDCILNPNQQKFVSSLQWREKVIPTKQKRTLLQKIIREILRMRSQILNFPYKTKLKFYR